MLLRQRADYRVISFRGETILHFAAGKGNCETLEILKEAALEELNVDLKNAKDQRAVDVIKSRNSQSLQVVAAFDSLVESLR
jgi:hypothetical protein